MHQAYERVRERLLDMTLRNPMLSYKHRATSKRQLQIVDEVPEEVFRQLTGDTSLTFAALPEPDDIPRDERTEEFSSNLTYAKATDVEYLKIVETADDMESDAADPVVAKAERALRDRLRTQLGMQPVDRSKAPDPAQHARVVGIDPSYELPPQTGHKRHTDRQLQTLKYPKPLDAVLAKLRSDARLAEQETGLSTLFLVFGFLEWTEKDEGKRLLAPLLLLPVQIEAIRSPLGKMTYALTATSSIPEDNLSLRKRIDKDFGVKLPEVPTDVEAGFSVESYLQDVHARVAHLKGWRTRRFLTVGHFVFGRLAMYVDLEPGQWPKHPIETKLVGAVMQGTEAGDGSAPLFASRADHPVDDPAFASKAPILIHDADASQHSTLIDAMDGKHLVIQGPPGTGKSQTITNLVANALAAGKTVLFLAEKQAALDVVKRRLETAGLGEFCLALHSDKASPKRVFEHLKWRIDQGVGRKVKNSPPSETALAQARNDISSYVTALHREAADGARPFDLMWKAIRAKGDDPTAFDPFLGVELPQAAPERIHEIEEAKAALSLYGDVATTFTGDFGPPELSPWNGVSFDENVGPGAAGAILDDLSTLLAAVKDSTEYVASVSHLGITDLEAVGRISAAIAGLPEPVPSAELLQILGRHPPESLADYMADLALEHDLASKASPWAATLSQAQRAAVESMAAVLNQDDRSPRQIHEYAARMQAEVERLIAALRDAGPFLQAIGLSGDTLFESLAAILTVGEKIAQLSADERYWLAWRTEGDFTAAYDAWLRFVAAERNWRSTLPNARSAWPSSELLRAASGRLRQNFLKRLFSAASRAVIKAASEELGLRRLRPKSAKMLEELATHIEALGAFATSGNHRHALGRHWAGLETPFDAAVRGMQLRDTMRLDLRQLPGGQDVAGIVDRLTDVDLARVAEANPNLDGLRKLPAALLTKAFGPIDNLLSDLARQQSRVKRIAASDLSGELRERDEPLSELSNAVRIERKRDETRARLAGNPLEAELSALSRGDLVSKLRTASDWLHESRAPELERVRERLLGENASAVLKELRIALSAGEAVVDRLKGALLALREDYGLDGVGSEPPAELKERLETLVNHAAELASFVDLQCQRRRAAALGLDPVLQRAWEARLAPDKLPVLFDNLLALKRAERLRRRDPVLSQAAGSRIEARRRAFVDADRRKIEIDRTIVRERLLSKQLPPGNSYGPRSTWTEGELLRNELNKQRRFVPVRDLMSRASASLQALTPCFMMSPLSLAKFLPRGGVRFDLLIIDEASQMRPEDALGGLLRVGQVIVVGDQKQLPPSQFFNRSDGSEPVSTDESVEDLDDESILEACAKTFRETRLLKWHYRSRCESLIAFSNRQFYGDDLITFPSAQPGSFSIDLVSLPGRYQSGRNPLEAQRVAEESIFFMRQHAEDAAPPSLGIVSVNSEQRDLIEEELQRLAADDDLVLRFQERIAARGEPFFVKNLENVQGDERDYIFISMTYGPEIPGGVVAQRFGPIAGKHGHRRLNVLFTRARLRIAIFASFGSKDVRPSETSAQGVRVLRSYFEYAERRGYAAVAESQDADSDLELDVARRLRSRGFQVDFQIGVSGFRIDLGVRHPDHPERFLAGVECDGAHFHSSKSARDRDRLREEILVGLGWKILRVWSIDWFDNPDHQTQILANRLEELRAAPVQADRSYRPASLVAPSGDEGTGSIALGPTYADGGPVEDSTLAPEQSQSGIGDVESEPKVQEMDAAELLQNSGPLTTEQLRSALRWLRDQVIAHRTIGWVPERSILRESMIETLVAQRVDDPDQWFTKVPNYLRVGTDPMEKRLYLDQICDLIGRLSLEARADSAPNHLINNKPRLTAMVH